MFILLVTSLSILAEGTPALISSSQDDQKKTFNHRTSHWIATFGFSGTQYKVPYSFVGQKKSYDEESVELQGGRLGVGMEAYMGLGFLLGARVEGYYMGTTFNRERFAKNVGNTEVRSENNRAQMYGGEVIGHAGWMFDYKTRNPFLGEMTSMAMELFGEVGAGVGQNYFSKNYKNADAVDEIYRARITESFRSATVAAGVNFLSRTTGYFLNLKVSRMFFDIDETKFKSRTGTASVPINNVIPTVTGRDVDPVTVIAVGGGYKF